MLANALAEKGEVLPAGAFIMTGALTAAVAVAPGDSVTVSYQGLGTLSAQVVWLSLTEVMVVGANSPSIDKLANLRIFTHCR